MLRLIATLLGLSSVLVSTIRSQTPPQDAKEVRALVAQWSDALAARDPRAAARLLCPAGKLSIERAALAIGCAAVRASLRAYLQPSAWRELDQTSFRPLRITKIQFLSPQEAVVTAQIPQHLNTIGYSGALGSCVLNTLRVTKREGLWRIDSAEFAEPTLCSE